MGSQILLPKKSFVPRTAFFVPTFTPSATAADPKSHSLIRSLTHSLIDEMTQDLVKDLKGRAEALRRYL